MGQRGPSFFFIGADQGVLKGDNGQSPKGYRAPSRSATEIEQRRGNGCRERTLPLSLVRVLARTTRTSRPGARPWPRHPRLDRGRSDPGG